MVVSGAKTCGLYLFPHIFDPQEYTWVNIKVVSAFVAGRTFFFFQEKLSISVANKASV